MEYLAFTGSLLINYEVLAKILLFIQEHVVQTSCGSLSVAVFGDQDKPALITYPDLALNCKEHVAKFDVKTNLISS